MKTKKIKILITDDNDDILKSKIVELKWDEKIEEELSKFYNRNASDEMIDLVFKNILKVLE